jgi:epoxyqueuosine reductase
VALGNLRDPAAVPALAGALADPEPLVRGHAAWALGQIGRREATDALEAAASRETDPAVQEEIRAALSAIVTPAPGLAASR